MTFSVDQLMPLGHNALRRVAQGHIVSDNGTLRHHSDVLPPDVITTVKVLLDHGFITLSAPVNEGSQRVAELTLVGMQLLGRWNKHTVGSESPTKPSATGRASADGSTSTDPMISSRRA